MTQNLCRSDPNNTPNNNDPIISIQKIDSTDYFRIHIISVFPAAFAHPTCTTSQNLQNKRRSCHVRLTLWMLWTFLKRCKSPICQSASRVQGLTGHLCCGDGVFGSWQQQARSSCYFGTLSAGGRTEIEVVYTLIIRDRSGEAPLESSEVTLT